MEDIEIKYKTGIQALSTLKEAIDNLEKLEKIRVITEELRESLENNVKDSIVQRFEYCFEFFWKYLKLYLRDCIGRGVDINGPKPIFRESLKAQILTKEETELCLKMTDDRNLTSHVYEENVANRIVGKSLGAYNLMLKIWKRVVPK